MVNQEVAEILQRMAELLEYFGDPTDHFRIRAYKNASLTLRELPENIADIAKRKELKKIPGIGEGIAKKIEEYVANGKVNEYEFLKKAMPAGLFELMAIPFLGPKKVRMLNKELGITNVKELEKAVKNGSIEELKGFGKKSADKILEGIQMKNEQGERRFVGEVFLTVNELIRAIRKFPGVSRAEPAGSFRRREETIGDIDILVSVKNPAKDSVKIMERFVKLPGVAHILGKGDTKSSVAMKDGLQVDLRVVSENQFGSALQYFTGSKKHNVHLRTFAKAKGFKVSEYGFFKISGSKEKLVASKTEEECYEALGLQYIPPEFRTDSGEIEAATKNMLPKNLIELKDIKGDLHAHSTYSDGGNTIEQMAMEAHRRGYEYIAITDHSPSLHVAHGLDKKRLVQKKKEIDKLNEKLPIRILFGTEVDIMKNGSIDYPDVILQEFDIVVASIHSYFNEDNTDRLLAAMGNPYVHIIGHPSGRLLGQRKPYQLDYEKIFERAAETGTIIEINAQPQRLDLADIYIRSASRAGVKFSIDSDAHSTDGLWLMDLGVSWARRGWVEKQQVVNTLSLDALKRALK